MHHGTQLFSLNINRFNHIRIIRDSIIPIHSFSMLKEKLKKDGTELFSFLILIV